MTRSDPKQPVDLIGLLTSKAQVSEPNRNTDIFTEQILFARMNTGEQMAGLHLCPSESTRTHKQNQHKRMCDSASLRQYCPKLIAVCLLAWAPGRDWRCSGRIKDRRDEMRRDVRVWREKPLNQPLDKEGVWKGHWMVHWSNMILDHQWKRSHFILCCSQAKQQIIDGFIVHMENMLLPLLLIILFLTNQIPNVIKLETVWQCVRHLLLWVYKALHVSNQSGGKKKLTLFTRKKIWSDLDKQIDTSCVAVNIMTKREFVV